MGGMTSLLLLLWLSVTVSTAVDLQKRIIGGHNCQDNERLYHVKLTYPEGNLRCGGSLISNQWILTAAHCWTWGITAVLRVHPRVGQQPLRVPIVERPFMFGDNNNILHDLMLLRLPNAVNFPTVQLPDCDNRPHVGDVVQMAGHAAIGPLQGRRRPAEVPYLQCANIHVHHPCPQTPPDNTFCGETPRVDACRGDSGGGVIFRNRIYGVIVIIGRDVCTRPVQFMDLCDNEYNKWIKKITQTPWERIKNAFGACFGCS